MQIVLLLVVAYYPGYFESIAVFDTDRDDTVVVVAGDATKNSVTVVGSRVFVRQP